LEHFYNTHPVKLKTFMMNSVYKGKSKGKGVPAHAINACRRNGGVAPFILNCGSRCRGVVSLSPLPLYAQAKSLKYPLNGRLGEPQSHFGEERNLFPLPEFES
jgi:hypothetical protein